MWFSLFDVRQFVLLKSDIRICYIPIVDHLGSTYQTQMYINKHIVPLETYVCLNTL